MIVNWSKQDCRVDSMEQSLRVSSRNTFAYVLYFKTLLNLYNGDFILRVHKHVLHCCSSHVCRLAPS